MKKHLLLIMLFLPFSGWTQTITDGLLMSRHQLCTGVMYTHDSWTDYWEGQRKRDNENIGTLTTQSLMWVGSYGISDKLNLIAMLPYIKTEASKGSTDGLKGLQDLTLALKWEFLQKKFETSSFKSFGVLSVSTPMSDYSPDFYPFSLGSATTNIAWRLSANYQRQEGWYANASGAYTWRSNTHLDRSSYYTGDQLYMTDEVKMPNVLDYVTSLGYLNKHIQAELFLNQQHTLGGADIRRQDMPFVSNQMNFTRAGALLMYYLPMHRNLALRASVARTLHGRNVGEATSLMGGLLYTFTFSKSTKIDSL